MLFRSQNGSEFNFSSMFPKDSTKQEEPKEEKSGMSWKIDLNNLAIVDGGARYTDLLLDNTIDLRQISLAVPSLVLGRGVTDAGLNLQLEQGSVMSKLHLNQEDGMYKLKLALSDIGIGIAKPYVKEALHVGEFEGNLYTDLEITGSLKHILEFVVSGDVALRDVDITTADAQPDRKSVV